MVSDMKNSNGNQKNLGGIRHGVKNKRSGSVVGVAAMKNRKPKNSSKNRK